jgi:hypothetical protein
MYMVLRFDLWFIAWMAIPLWFRASDDAIYLASFWLEVRWFIFLPAVW